MRDAQKLTNLKPTSLLGTFVLAALLAGCMNTRLSTPDAANLTGGSSSSGSGTPDSGTSGPAFVISQINITAVQNSTPAAQQVKVFFDTSRSPTALTTTCNANTSTTAAKPCLCQFVWQEVNPYAASSTPVQRMVQTRVTSVQASYVSCLAPEAYANNEIPNGTVLQINIVPGSANSSSFSVAPYSYKKTSGGQTGSFQDSQGHFFDNILHYSCYEQTARGMEIQSKIAPLSDSQGGSAKVALATQFCVRKANASSTDSTDTEACPNLGPSEYTAQSYYYNLFIRDSERGDINYGKSGFVCPQIKEPLIPGNGPNQAYPLDSTFALALSPSTDFPVGVEAFTKVSNGADPVSQSTSCSGSSGGTSSSGSSGTATSGLIKSCLGFAAKPNKDGTCPLFRSGSNNEPMPTYRLRRFVALYPPIFDTTGEPLNQAQSTDTIYVLDRPVNAAGSNQDPSKPYTMRGPKPCPFAFFDRKGVLGLQDAAYKNSRLPVYGATNNPNWTGTNVDGIQLPYFDSQPGEAVLSCSAAMPIWNQDKSIMSFATVNAANPIYKKVYIRPIQAWAPHYEEDTDFQACAPQASPLRDPPLHFAKDPATGNVSWCAEAYPTQNMNVKSLDQLDSGNPSKLIGRVNPFTSHVSKNSASPACTSSNVTWLDATYPLSNPNPSCPAYPGSGNPQGLARHPRDLVVDSDSIDSVNYCAHQTCDRTVSTSELAWPQFPLLARPAQVEAAISSDTTYGCIVTYDAGSGKAGKFSPSGGCCGNSVHVWSGLAPAAPNNKTSAHLEPSAACLEPQY